jgi:hypothetical protein
MPPGGGPTPNPQGIADLPRAGAQTPERAPGGGLLIETRERHGFLPECQTAVCTVTHVQMALCTATHPASPGRSRPGTICNALRRVRASRAGGGRRPNPAAMGVPVSSMASFKQERSRVASPAGRNLRKHGPNDCAMSHTTIRTADVFFHRLFDRGCMDAPS